MPRRRFSMLLRLALCVALGGCRFELARSLPAGELQGIVTGQRSSDGAIEPQEGVRVRLEGTPFSVTSDPRGRFRVRGVPSGEHTVLISRDSDGDGDPDSLLRLRRVDIEPTQGARGARDLGPLLVTPAGCLSGVAIGPDGPVRNAAVAVQDQPHVFARTNALGEFSFPFLAPGTYVLVLVAGTSGDTPAATLGTFDVASGEVKNAGRVEATPLDGAGELSGTVVLDDAATGVAVTDVQVVLLGVGGETRTAPVQPDGSFRAVDLPNGVYTVRVLGANGVREFFAPGQAVHPGAVRPPLFVFSAEAPLDVDGDGTPDDDDPKRCREDHVDRDRSGICDHFEPDPDHDGVATAADNCAAVANADQADADVDGVGDACDLCPTVRDPDQEDANGDGIDECAENARKRSCAYDKAIMHEGLPFGVSTAGAEYAMLHDSTEISRITLIPEPPPLV